MLADLSIGSLFSGIGGLELGLEWAGLGPTRWQVEQDPFCRRVLARHWPDARRYDDVRTFDPTTAEPVRILCGGFPCQDVSVAGAGVGLDGERSGLWFEFLRVIKACRPSVVVVENVPGLVRRGLDVVVGGLRGAGYQVEGTIIGADDVGAPHRRKRLFLLGYRFHPGMGNPNGEMFVQGVEAKERASPGVSFRTGGGAWETIEPRVGGGSDGLSSWLDGHRWPAGRGTPQHPWEPPRTVAPRSMPDRAARVKALGNAVCPQVAYVVGMRVRQMLNLKVPPS